MLIPRHISHQRTPEPRRRPNSPLGIGYDLSVELANSGATVLAVARTQADLDQLQAECSDSIVPVLLDIADANAIDASLSGVGDIDMVVNNAGIANLQPFMEVSSDQWDQVNRPSEDTL